MSRVEGESPGQRFDRDIVEGPILPVVWKLAWPTMLQNVIAGLQGLVDHAMVGHIVGYTGNAAIGVSWQIFLVVIVFVSSLYTGMGVLVARFAGAADADKVNRVVYQAFFASIAMACLVLAPLGYILSPWLLNIINAAPEVRMEALPYLRAMFVFSIGILLFFMLGGALRAAGDARTPLRLGIALTVLNVIFNLILIPGLGPIPALGTLGAALGSVLSAGLISVLGIYLLFTGGLVVRFSLRMRWRPDWPILRSLFRFGMPTGFQGVAMNLGGALLLHFIGSLEASAEAQAAYTVGYGQLFSFITWTAIGLMGATAAISGQSLGAGRPYRAHRAVHTSAVIGLGVAAGIGLLFLVIPRLLLALFGMKDPLVLSLGAQLLRYLSLSGLFIVVALAYTGGLQGTGDTRGPMGITIFSQFLVPVGLCFLLQETYGLEPAAIWIVIVIGHLFRSLLSVMRFNQGKWMHIKVDVH